MRLVEAAIDRYGPIAGWAPELTEGVTVISGPNEAGKTLYLEALLQLLDPEVAGLLEPGPRVPGEPVGRVVVDHDGDRHQLGDGLGLSALTNVQPVDIPTVFVVRDSDLEMPAGKTYYTDLIEHLGEVHTSAIDAIDAELQRLGRVTEGDLRLSTPHDDAKPTRNAAKALRDEIDGYLTEIEAEGIAELQRERIGIDRERSTVRRALEEQDAAERVHRHDRLSEALDAYETACSTLDELEGITRDRLDSLRGLDREVDRYDTDIETVTDAIERCRDDLEEVDRSLDEATERLHRLEGRADRVDRAESALETYRSQMEAVTGTDRPDPIGRIGLGGGAIGASIAGSVAAFTGSTPLFAIAGVLLVVTLLAGAWMVHQRRRKNAVERAASRAVASAQDAGLEVDDVDAVAPAIEAFRSDLDQTGRRVVRHEARAERLEEELDGLQEDLDDRRSDRDTAADELQSGLEAAGVEDIEAFAGLVDDREAAERARELNEQRLTEELGEVGGEDRIQAWRARIDDLLTDLDRTDVAAEDYDAARHAELEARLAELETRRGELADTLEGYDAALDRFDERARELSTRPFIDDDIALVGRSPAAVRTLRDDLDTLIDAIERDADRSRHAVRILREIRADQQRKITDLFDPDGPASRAFRRITGGRYEHVDYDADQGTLVAERSDGETVGVHRLSAGATDQLYLATRLSLARRLLDGTPGFLLLDEPLATADPDRLHRGFEALVDLAADGWQLVYLTAKDEVYDGMVDAFDLAHEPVSPIG